MNKDMQQMARIITFGEIMLRLDCLPGQRFQRAEGFKNFYGGAEANVSVVLSQLGIATRYITALPSNELGQAAIDELRSFGVDTSCIRRSGERIGIYFTENGNGIRPSRVIYDRKNSSFAGLVTGELDWVEILEGADYFFWTGISAALTPGACEVCLEGLKIAKARGLTIAADMNYRRSLWDYGKHPSQIMPELLSYCDIITGDLDTIEVFFGIGESAGSNEDKFRYCTGELKNRLPDMHTLAMSFRGGDSANQQTYSGALFSKNGFYFSPVWSLPQVVDRIGSGDAFQGGLLYGLIKGFAAQETIDFGIACGAIKHSVEGDFALVSQADVSEFTKNGAVNRVIR